MTRFIRSCDAIYTSRSLYKAGKGSKRPKSAFDLKEFFHLLEKNFSIGVNKSAFLSAIFSFFSEKVADDEGMKERQCSKNRAFFSSEKADKDGK